MMSVLLSVIATLIAALICAEAKAWAPRTIKLLLRLAVSQAPADLKQRLHEEWTAYLDEVPGIVGKFTAALGFVCAAANIGFSRKAKRWRLRAKMFGLRHFFIAKAFLEEASVGPLRTRMSRGFRAASFTKAVTDFFFGVAKFVVDDVIPSDFGRNVMDGGIKMLQSRRSNEPNACWGMNVVTGEVVKVPGGAPGTVVKIDPNSANTDDLTD